MYGRIASVNINKAPSSIMGFRKDTMLHLDVAGILWGQGSCDGAVLASHLLYAEDKINSEVVRFFETAYEHISNGRLPRSFDCSTTTEFRFTDTSDNISRFLETFATFIRFLKTDGSLGQRNNFPIFDGEPGITTPARVMVKKLFDKWWRT